MSILSLNGITNLGNVHARSIGLINTAGTGFDDILTLIAAGGGSGGGLTSSQVNTLINTALL